MRLSKKKNEENDPQWTCISRQAWHLKRLELVTPEALHADSNG